MKHKSNISITLDNNTLSEIDSQRGLIPRSAFIEDKIKNIIRGAN